MHKDIHGNGISPCPLLNVIVSLEEVSLRRMAPQREREEEIKIEISGRSFYRNS